MSKEIDDEVWGFDGEEIQEDLPIEDQEEIIEEEEIAEENIEEDSPRGKKTPTDSLSAREKEIESARLQLELEEVERQKSLKPAPKSLNIRNTDSLLEGFDLSNVKIPHPTEKGKDISISALKEEYPDIIGFVEVALSAIQAKNEENLAALHEAQSEKLFALELTQLHPDAKEIFKDKKFKDFVAKSSEAVQSLVRIGDASDVALVIDRYKAENKIPASRGALPSKSPSSKSVVVPKSQPKTQTKEDIDREVWG